MSDPEVSINGIRANFARLRVPFAGPWYAAIRYDSKAPLDGSVTIAFGDTTLKGSVVDEFTGTYLGVVRLWIVGGAAGWRNVVKARAYHNDAGVKRADVLSGLAQEVGETIDVSADTSRLRVDYVRRATFAARALDDVLMGTPWRVDYDGTTRYGDRPAATLGPNVRATFADPATKVITLVAPSLSALPLGAQLNAFDLSVTVQEIEAHFEDGSTRIQAWGLA